MADLSTLQEIALIAAAVAALASLASVAQTRRIARAATLPDLAIQMTYDDQGHVNAVIHNAGGGVARGLSFVIAEGGETAFEYAGHGFIRPNELLHVYTAVRHVAGAKGGALVSCRDRYGYGHVWTKEETHRVLKTRIRRRPQYGQVLDRFRALYPDLDPEKLKRAGSKTVREP